MFVLIALIAVIIKIAVPVLLIVFLVKGIKYLNKKNKED